MGARRKKKGNERRDYRSTNGRRRDKEKEKKIRITPEDREAI